MYFRSLKLNVMARQRKRATISDCSFDVVAGVGVTSLTSSSR
jgi:hypothetical protein